MAQETQASQATQEEDAAVLLLGPAALCTLEDSRLPMCKFS